MLQLTLAMGTNDQALDLVRDVLLITLKISLPILLAGVVVGLIVSIAQSVTSIQDQSLVFVPKIVVMLVVSMALIPWIVARLVAFTTEMFVLR
ncbi:MAG: flagellar biosynthetic protein FliQ [Phycisphaerales bacterium]|jgi:flagellar biosynthetic protein FliQ|nr:flagellar biosynthetic protein FliQ [Phycisphaerales bacterium]